MITRKALRYLGCFTLLILLAVGCESSSRKAQKMQEVMGEYELTQPGNGYPIPEELYEANKIARIVQTGDHCVLNFNLPRLNQSTYYTFIPFSLSVDYNQILGEYLVTPPSEQVIREAGITSYYLQNITLDPEGFKIDKFYWRKR